MMCQTCASLCKYAEEDRSLKLQSTVVFRTSSNKAPRHVKTDEHVKKRAVRRSVLQTRFLDSSAFWLVCSLQQGMWVPCLPSTVVRIEP
jgi:hypothetical protein